MNKEMFADYLREGFKPLLCKGFHSASNPSRDYKTAKQPIREGFTRADYQLPTNNELDSWIAQGGWPGWVIPKGYIAIDIEDSIAISYLENLCKQKSIDPAVHITNKGKHFFFHIPNDLPAASKVFTKAGFPVTYRIGGKNQLILAPVNGRKWQSWKTLSELPELPEELYPYDRNNKVEVLRCLSWTVGEYIRAKTLHGYDDVDTAFMAFLIDRGFSEAQVSEAFQLVFISDYDHRGTSDMFTRTKAKIQNGEIIRGAGSFVQKIKDMGLKDIEVFVRQLQVKPEVSELSGIGVGQTDTPDFKPFSVLKKGSELGQLNITIEWAIDRLLPRQSITLLHGRGGIGKTWLSLIMADAISKRIPFMGLDTVSMPVIFIDFENSLPVLVDRIKRIGIEDVLFWHNSNELLRPPKLDKEDWNLYQQLPEGSLLIYDTLRASQGQDENDSRHMAFILSRLKELRDKGFTILLLHHAPKSNDRTYKGSTAILDLADHVLSLHKVKKGNPEGGEIEDDDDQNCLYRLGTKDKTRYEPFHIFMAFDKAQGFVKALDPDEEDLQGIYEILQERGTLNQKQIFEILKDEIDIKSKGKAINLLRKGEGKYWTSHKIKNAVYYETVRVSTPICGQTDTSKKDPLEVSRIERTDTISNTLQSLDNSQVSKCPEGIQTLRTDEVIEVLGVSE